MLFYLIDKITFIVQVIIITRWSVVSDASSLCVYVTVVESTVCVLLYDIV